MANLLLKALLSIVLLTVVYSDFKTRTISVWQLLATALGFVAWGLYKFPYLILAENTAFNFLFLSAQLFFLWVWLALKERRLRGFWGKYIGAGDLWFMLLFVVLMPLQQFVWFYTGSIIIVLLFALMAKLARPDSFQTVPLAGGLAVCLIVYFLIEGSVC